MYYCIDSKFSQVLRYKNYTRKSESPKIFAEKKDHLSTCVLIQSLKQREIYYFILNKYCLRKTQQEMDPIDTSEL